MSVKSVSTTLATALATSGTLAVSYPSGTDAGWFKGGVKHKLVALGKEWSSPADFAITTFGSTTFTITWRATPTIPANSVIRIGLDVPGLSYRDPTNVDAPPNKVTPLYARRISLGAPLTADADGIATAAPAGGSGSVTINGAQASGGVATMDVPRNVVIPKTALGTLVGATFAVTGLDVFLKTMQETIAGQGTGTDAVGVKAFYKVTSVVIGGTSLASATTSFTVGFGDVLGLPVHLPAAANVIKELEDLAAASSGTIVAGLSTATVSTATTADVRGTYDPSSACNGSKVFELLVLLSDPDFKGNPQFGETVA